MATSIKHSTPRHRREWAPTSILSHSLVQLFVTLTIGIAVPLGVYVMLFPHALRSDYVMLLTTTLSVAATIGAVTVSSRMVQYPGISHAGMIFPAFGSAFALVLATLLVLREPYSNTVLTIAFVGTSVVQFAIAALLRRSSNPVHYLVPGGRVSAIAQIPGCLTYAWPSPDYPLPKDAIVVADLHFDHSDEWERRMARAALDSVPIFHFKQVQESVSGRVRIDHLSENVLGSLIPSNSYHLLKRTFDICVALALMPLLLFFFPLVAIVIKLDSPGPIFFKQERVGFRAKIFKVLKFRTMRVSDQSTDLRAAMTTTDDARITKLGKFLRRTRIDELPQVWNILNGDMSWIGPRPEALALSEWYAGEIPFYEYRHIVRPGISGWAQVNQGHVTELEDIHAKLQYDFFYIKNFSYWLDIIIAVRTAAVIFNGFGAK